MIISKIKETLIIKRKFSTFSDMKLFTKKNLLIKNVEYNKILRRTMMAEGSTLTPNQKKMAVMVLTIHAKFLSLKDPSEEDFLRNLQYGMLVAGKPFQHFMTVLYKNKQFSVELVKKTFP